MFSGFQPNAFQVNAYQIVSGVVAPAALAPNGNRRQEYQPAYYELKDRLAIERKFEDAEIDLRVTNNKIEELEFQRLWDLADQAMQRELLQLLTQQQELMALIEQMQQQKLRALNDDDEFVFLLMTCLN